MNPKKTYTFKRYFKNKIYLGIFSFSLIFVILAIALAMWKLKNELSIWITIVLAVLLLFLEWYFFREKGELDKVFDHNERTWGKGAKGETAVFELLNQQLNSLGYHIFNDFKLEKQKGNIDVVVVGPTGVFAIEVKNWPGKIFYDNCLYRNNKISNDEVLLQVYAEKCFLEDFLKGQLGQVYKTQGLLVFSDGYVHESAHGLIRGVYLDHIKYLIKRIKSFPISLSTDEIGKISRIISNAYSDTII